MPTPFIMPKMDMDQESVTILEWLKKEGEKVEKGEAVIVVETDKLTSEIEAPASGTLTGILYKENEEAPVTKVVAYILAEGESPADVPTDKAATLAAEKPEAAKSAPAEEKPVKATPVAERMAAQMDIKLEQVPASGRKVTKADVESFAKGQFGVEPRVKVPATPAARAAAQAQGLAIEGISGSGPRGRVQQADVLAAAQQPKPAAAPPLAGTSKPMVGMRKRIAERLTASYQNAPHIYLTVEVDMSAAEASRKRLNKLAEKQGQPSLSITTLLVKMVAWALKRHPYLNASLISDEINFWEDVNIGVATALEEGLIVPVIHGADMLSLSQINDHVRTLASKAREGTLSREEIDGGTFTISNLGMYGITSFTAIINPPQSAILAVGGMVRKPVVVDDKDTLAVRPIMTMTLSADHRIVDGANAASFLNDLVSVLETPELALY